MSKVLVTGSSGFIGKHLVKALEDRGDEVVKLSLREPSDLLGLLEQLDTEVVYHLAAYGNMASQKDHGEIFETNLVKTYSLLEATKTFNYKAFINVSTSSVLLPHETMYSATKAGAERLCRAFVNEYGKPITTIRPYSVYGAGEADFRFIPTVFRSCIRGDEMILNPDAVHDWVHVDDLVHEMIATAHDIKAFPPVRNIGTGYQTSNKEVVAMIEKITGKKANITGTSDMRSYDTQYWKASDIHRGYTKLEDGLNKYYLWYMGMI